MIRSENSTWQRTARWHPVVAAASRRRISAAGRLSYAVSVISTFYE